MAAWGGGAVSEAGTTAEGAIGSAVPFSTGAGSVTGASGMAISSSLTVSVAFMGISGDGVVVVAIVVPAVTVSVVAVSGIALDSAGAVGGGAATGTSAGDSTGKGAAMSVIMRDLICGRCNQLLIPMRSPD